MAKIMYPEKKRKKEKKRNSGDSHFNKDLWPVLILLIGCHQQIASKNRHKAVPLCFEVDRSITTQEAAQGLENHKDTVKFPLGGSLRRTCLYKAKKTCCNIITGP